MHRGVNCAGIEKTTVEGEGDRQVKRGSYGAYRHVVVVGIPNPTQQTQEW